MEAELKEEKSLKLEIKNKISTYLTAGFALVVGLAWNDAIRALIDYLYPLEKNSVTAKFIYAFLLTFILVFITTYLARALRKEEK